MDVFKHYRLIVVDLIERLTAQGKLPEGLRTDRVTVEPPRKAAHGDLATNAAMVLAKPAKMRPPDVAELLVPGLEKNPDVASVEIAGPGFINLRLTESFWQARLGDILAAGVDYGMAEIGGGRKINVEYVSANPTGPLHVGHGRGAVFGDALANLLERVGFEVTREYYVNDAGAQVEILAKSLAARYGEALGAVTLDEESLKGLYPGEYLKPVGKKLAKQDGDKWLHEDDEKKRSFLIQYSVKEMMDLVRADLDALGIRFDVYTFERALVEDGKVQHALDELEARGLIYRGVLEPPKGQPPPGDWEPREQLLFRSSAFGDDTDRPLKKSDGSWTYFAADVAYHLDKFERGFEIMIDVWGADHAGYVKRMKAAVEAVTGGAGQLDVKLCQLVNLFKRGEPLRMSKRAGAFVTLREVIDAVGKDVVRFIMLTRKNDAPLDFDLAKVTEQSKDNPVFYVQYAHARVCSVMRKVAADMPGIDLSTRALREADLGVLTDASELALIKLSAAWPRTVEGAAAAHEPHRLAFYLYDLASAFHLLWTKGTENPALRFMIAEDPRLTRARLAMIKAVALIIASGLTIFGVEPVEEMR